MWRKRLEEADKKVCEAQRLLEGAEEQSRRVAALSEHVDATAGRLRQLRSDNHFGPLIESILKGTR